MALTTHAMVSINLGHNEEAVEAALLSVRLSPFLEKNEHSVLSLRVRSGISCAFGRRIRDAMLGAERALWQ